MEMTSAHKQLYKKIDEILWKEWDPIGINDIEDARDEYENYTPQIFSLKLNGAGRDLIANKLFEFETKYMGVNGSLEQCINIADKIYKL